MSFIRFLSKDQTDCLELPGDQSDVTTLPVD